LLSLLLALCSRWVAPFIDCIVVAFSL